MNRTLALLLAAGVGLTGGCTTFGTNVRGDFACRAPEGTCRPMTAIDAAAVDVLGGEQARVAETSRPARAPAGPVGSGSPVRVGERTLTILLPAHVDEAGILHDAATVHAVVEPGGWAFAPDRADKLPEFSRSSAPSSLREAIAGASAPAIEGLESLPRAPQPIIAATAGSDDAVLPTVAAIAAARAGHRIGRSEPATIVPSTAIAPSASKLPKGKVVPGRGDAAAAGTRAKALAAPLLAKPALRPAAPPDGDPGDPFGSLGGEQPK